jgi:hypothetical protein
LFKPQSSATDRSGTAAFFRRYHGLTAGRQNGGWHVFWIYWDTAWSLIISGIMFTTIVTHPDAEFVEIQAARRAK